MSAGNSVKVLARVGTASGFMMAGAYTQIGFAVNASFANACFLIRIINATNQDISISYDGVTDHDYLIAGQTLQITSQTNSPHNVDCALFPIGTKVYAKGLAGAGTIYLTGYYLQQY